MNSGLPRDTASRVGEPTEASPGSAHKILVLTERASRREALFHPQDNLKRQPIGHQDEPEPNLAPELDEMLEADLELEEVDLAG